MAAAILKTKTGYEAAIKYRIEVSGEYVTVTRKRMKLSAAKFDVLKKLDRGLIVIQREVDSTHLLTEGNCMWSSTYTITVGNKTKTYNDFKCAISHTLLLKLFGLKP